MRLTKTEVILIHTARETLKALRSVDLSPLRNKSALSEQERVALQTIANAQFLILSGMSEIFDGMANTDTTQQEHDAIYVAL